MLFRFSMTNMCKMNNFLTINYIGRLYDLRSYMCQRWLFLIDSKLFIDLYRLIMILYVPKIAICTYVLYYQRPAQFLCVQDTCMPLNENCGIQVGFDLHVSEISVCSTINCIQVGCDLHLPGMAVCLTMDCIQVEKYQ